MKAAKRLLPVHRQLFVFRFIFNDLFRLSACTSCTSDGINGTEEHSAPQETGFHIRDTKRVIGNNRPLGNERPLG